MAISLYMSVLGLNHLPNTDFYIFFVQNFYHNISCLANVNSFTTAYCGSMSLPKTHGPTQKRGIKKMSGMFKAPIGNK